MVSNKGRLQELDSLRGIAAIMVVIYHYFHYFFGIYPQFRNQVPFTADLRLGELGVMLFFMVSGFVIFMTVKHAKRPADFIISRLSRLYPAYWGSVLFIGASLYLFGDQVCQWLGWKTFFANLTMVQFYFSFYNLDGVYWTLGLELWFYTLIFILYFSGQLKNINYWFLAYTLLGIYITLNFAGAEQFNRRNRYLLHLYHFPQLFYAGILYYQIYIGERKAINFIFLAISLAANVVMLENPTIPLLLTIATYYGVFMLLVYHRLGWIINPVFSFLGKISYSIYLIHGGASYLFMKALYNYGFTGFWPAIFCLSLVVPLSYAFNIYIENPASKWFRGYLTDLYEVYAPKWLRQVKPMQKAA